MRIGIDYETGAPPAVRRAIAALRDRNDKLAALRQIYPDARPDPSNPDNFIFTDPKSGQLHLLTPEATNLATLPGDAAAWVPAASEFLGSALGAAGGAAAGAPGGPVTAFGSGMLGAGLGGAAGREAATKASLAAAGMSDPRGMGKQLIDTGVSAASNALGEGAGRAVVGVLGAATPFVRDATGLLADRMGIPITAGQGSGSGLLGRVESSLRESPFGGRVRATDRQAGEAAGDMMSGAASTVARGAQLPVGPGGRADILGPAITRAAERHAAWATGEADTIASLISASRSGGRVQPVALQSLRDELAADLTQAPEARRAAIQPALDHIDRILADAHSGAGLDFRTAMRLRTDLGKITADYAPGGVNPSVGGPSMDRIAGALREDMLRTAGTADVANQAATHPIVGQMPPPSLYDRLRAFDDTITDLRGGTGGGGAQTVLERMAKTTDTDAFQGMLDVRTLLTSPNRTRALIAGLERNGEAGAAQQLRASIIDEIGRAKSGGQNAAGDVFSFNTFLTNYDAARRSGALDAIFPDTSRVDRRVLDNIAEVAGRLRDLRAGDNTSHSAGTMGTLLAMGGLGGAAGYLFGGNKEEVGVGTVAGAMGRVLVPLISARMLATPSIARWLSRALSAAETGVGTNLGGHLGRLAGMKVEDAATQGELDALREQIKNDPTLGPLYEEGAKAKPGKRSEAEPAPEPPAAAPGPVPAGLLQTGQAVMPTAVPPGLLVPDPAAAQASAQFAQAQQQPGQGLPAALPPGLLTGDPEMVLRSMLG